MIKDKLMTVAEASLLQPETSRIELLKENEELKAKIKELLGQIELLNKARYEFEQENTSLLAKMFLKDTEIAELASVHYKPALIQKLQANQIKGRCKDCAEVNSCKYHLVNNTDYCSEFTPKEGK